jgi:Protein of unknown function (DUF3106)
MRPPSPTTQTLRATGPAVLCCAAITALIGLGSALAQTKAPATEPAKAAPATAVRASASAAMAPQAAAINAGKPWKSLDASQQTALAPLSLTWETLNAGQKSKWLELSKNYATLPAAEQAKLQTRMGDWAKLSTQQRAQARHNFAINQAITSGLNAEQRSAQWQAYQLLSPQEKQALAEQSGKAAVATAANPRPVEPLKNTPAPQFGSANALAAQSKITTSASSKITIAPHLQKSNSLKSSVSVAIDKPAPGADGASATARQ